MADGESGTITCMSPRDTHTKIRSIRVGDDLWDAATRIATQRGETVSDVVRASLERYVKRHS